MGRKSFTQELRELATASDRTTLGCWCQRTGLGSPRLLRSQQHRGDSSRAPRSRLRARPLTAAMVTYWNET